MGSVFMDFYVVVVGGGGGRDYLTRVKNEAICI